MALKLSKLAKLRSISASNNVDYFLLLPEVIMILKSVGIGALALSTLVGSSSSSEAGIFDRLYRKGRSTPQCASPCVSTPSVCAAPATCAYSYVVSDGCGSANYSGPVRSAAPVASTIEGRVDTLEDDVSKIKSLMKIP
jgi:hypothetical protein